jgi:hypothetical protein
MLVGLLWIIPQLPSKWRFPEMLVAHKMDGLIKCHFMPLFIMENHIEMNDLGGVPHFRQPPNRDVHWLMRRPLRGKSAQEPVQTNSAELIDSKLPTCLFFSYIMYHMV